MKKLLSTILAVGVSFAPLSSAFAQVDVGVGPVGVQVGHNRDRNLEPSRDHNRVAQRDHGRDCRMVVVKSHRDGMVVTRRIRQCG